MGNDGDNMKIQGENQGDYVEKILGEFHGIVQLEKAQNKSRFVP